MCLPREWDPGQYARADNLARADVVQFYVLPDSQPVVVAPSSAFGSHSANAATHTATQTASASDGLSTAESSRPSGLFTVLDVPGRICCRTTQPHWGDEECLRDAVTHSCGLLNHWRTSCSTPLKAMTCRRSLCIQPAFCQNTSLWSLCSEGNVRSHLSAIFQPTLPWPLSSVTFALGPIRLAMGSLTFRGGFVCQVYDAHMPCTLPLPHVVTVFQATPETLPVALTTAGTGDN